MKTLKNLLVIVLALATSISTYAAVVVPALNGSDISSPLSGQLVKATYFNGEWIPMVDLPEVEIVGTRHGVSVLKGYIRNGEIIATVELPVVEITGDRVGDITFETIYDLPVIEIVADFPDQNLLHGENGDNGVLAVVDLPEITVSVSRYDQANFLTENTTDENPEQFNNYTFRAELSPEFIATFNPQHPASKTENYYTISLANCIITQPGKRVCELALKLSNVAMEELKANLIEVVAR